MPVAVVMSKKFQSIRRFFGVLGLTLQFFTFAAAQEMNVTLSIDEKRPFELRVSGMFKKERSANESHILAFSESIAGVALPLSRISSATAKDRDATELQLVSTPRCCIAMGKIETFSYNIDLSKINGIRSEAHASWHSNQFGILMLGDILPQDFLPSGRRRSANVSIELPNGWRTFSSERRIEEHKYSVADIDNAVIFVGKNWTETSIGVLNRRFTILMNGDHQFSQTEVADKVRAITTAYFSKYGELKGERYTIALFKPRSTTPFDTWEADTRGTTALIATVGKPFKSQSLQQLDEQLRHEIFHLWIPNGVNLSGNYDWFYEGFALYSSLKLAVESNTIRFEDMLDTLTRALAANDEQRPQIGLIQLSKSRFSGSESHLYSKGLVFAFLCDLALNVASKGKKSTDTLVREIFERNQNDGVRSDGTNTVLTALLSNPELRPLVEQFVTPEELRSDKRLINATTLLENSGLELALNDGRKKLVVKQKLTSRQKAILDKLGYNSWRKLVKDSK